MRRWKLIGPAAVAGLVLTGCGSTPDGGHAATSSTAVSVSVVDSGFGQRNNIVEALIIVKSNDPRAVGEFVTVSVNFLDSTGEILATEEQVESFTWDSQELALPVHANIDGDVDSIEVSTSLSDHGTTDAKPKLREVDARLESGEFAPTVATFELVNRSSEPLTDLRVGVVCFDAKGNIVGGGREYPALIAPRKEIKVSADVVVQSSAKKCRAFPNYGSLTS